MGALRDPLPAVTVHRPPATARCRSNPFAPTAAVALCGVLLAVATALTVTGFWASATPSPAGSGGAGVRAIRAFYTAADAVVARGNGSAIEAVLDAGVRIQRAGGIETDPAAFAAELAAIGRATGGLRFTVVGIVAEGDRAAAHVALRDPTGYAAEGTVFFSLDGDRITSIWDGLDLDDFPRNRPSAILPSWHGPTPVVLARLVLPPGAELPDLSVPGPHLFVPEAGELDVASGGKASLQDAGTDAWRPKGPGQTVRLRSGDALLVDPGVSHRVRNPGPHPASVLGLAVLPAMSSIGASSSFNLAYDLYGGTAGSTFAGIDGVTSTILAAGTGAARFDPCAEGPVTLTITSASLPAGEAIPARPVRGVEVVARAADAAPVVPAGSPRRASTGRPRPQSASSVRPTDQGSAASDRIAAELRNQTGRPLDVTTFALVPAGTDGCTR